jgi:hypothetical protein
LMHTDVISAPAVTGILLVTAQRAFKRKATKKHALMLLLLSSLAVDAAREKH